MTDGGARPVKFDLPGPEYEETTWLHNEHGASSSSPLSQTVGIKMGSPDDENELPRQITVNSYSYSRTDEWPPESALSGHLKEQEIPEDDSNLQDWRERCLPMVDEVVREIDVFDPESVPPGGWKEAIDGHQKRISEVMRLVHGTAVFHAQIFAETFAARYVAEFGQARQAEGLAMLQGFPNVSTERAVHLWKLGRIARRSPSVMSAVEAGALPSGDGEAEVEFRSSFAAAMDRFGHMNPRGMEDQPMWREDISVPLAIVRQYATEDDGRDPRVGERIAVARRQELEAALAETARESDVAAELLKLLPYAQHIGPVTEDHNLLADQKMSEVSRERWLKIGELLRRRGDVRETGDVFFYRFDELLALLESGVQIGREELAARKEQLALWRSVIPPAILGKGAQVGSVASGGIVVTGRAAAAGTYTGRARVINSVTEADVLEEGDVLVCDITTPAWTPYFAVIGAVVTNIGSVLAHGAIVAREFGIPAVVGVGDGTVVIPDGATVTVNGTAGTVTVETG